MASTAAWANSSVRLTPEFAAVRGASLRLAVPLTDADASAQSMEDASPAKWHLAHTTWFFETFFLAEFVDCYRAFDPAYAFLFNSYYESAGPHLKRDRRGMLTRPSLRDILDYRDYVDAALMTALPTLGAAARSRIELGCHHEQQHQELLLTDILHLFAQNPLEPAYSADAPALKIAPHEANQWLEHEGGMAQIGYIGTEFAFDCERPRHDIRLYPFAIRSKLVTNGEWMSFIDDGGYQNPALWLSDGWAWVNQEAIGAPLYWRREPDGWSTFTLSGRRPVDPALPIMHLSYFEADAFAAWAGARLPSEAEWEMLCRAGNAAQMFDSAWQWTRSSYAAYPGFRPTAGAIGEYNGKFMCGQYVLKGASFATPDGHSRPSYRNFFYPHQRWQFTGLRLAKDL